jgi:CBS domain-containing protein
MRVEDVMTRNVRTVRAESSLKDVAELLSRHGIGGMPVVDGDGEPLGVVTKADIVIKERAEVPRPRHWWQSGNGAAERVLSKVHARTAGEAMSAPAVTIDPIMPLGIAAEKMLAQGVNRLPVVQRGKLVGIVARHDLVSAFARGDAELAHEIRSEALSELSWPEALELTVVNGEVTLRGQVDTVGEAQSLPVQVRHVLGVVSVDSELSAWDPGGERRVAVTAHL